MRRTASEVLRSLEMRVARLEREASPLEDNVGFDDFLKGRYLKKEMKEDGLSFGDTLDDFQWNFMNDAWAEHLMTKHNINKDFAYYMSGRYICRVFNYKMCRMIKIQDRMR